MEACPSVGSHAGSRALAWGGGPPRGQALSLAEFGGDGVRPQVWHQSARSGCAPLLPAECLRDTAFCHRSSSWGPRSRCAPLSGSGCSTPPGSQARKQVSVWRVLGPWGERGGDWGGTGTSRPHVIARRRRRKRRGHRPRCAVTSRECSGFRLATVPSGEPPSSLCLRRASDLGVPGARGPPAPLIWVPQGLSCGVRRAAGHAPLSFS